VDTAVGDEGLGQLKGLTQLPELSVLGTHVTEGGVEELQKALPKVKVHR
jgi:hypothetical protein